ncbi:hypothetical protein ANANG_G00243240, partial [Anguilla anguilla]
MGTQLDCVSITFRIISFLGQVFYGFGSGAEVLALGALRYPLLPAEGTLPPGPQVRTADLRHLEGVHDRIDGRVGVREEDPDVDGDQRDVAAEDRHAVHDAQRQPADGEEDQDQQQGLGQLPLFGVVRVGFGTRGLAPLQPLGDGAEDMDVEGTHHQQGEQRAPEELEVDQVSHGHDGQERADDGGGVLHHHLGQGLAVVPAEHGRETEREGEQPARSDHGPAAPLREAALVSAKTQQNLTPHVLSLLAYGKSA